MIWSSNLAGQRDSVFMTKWNSNIFGHMEFVLYLIFFRVVGRKLIAREIAFFPLVVLLKQQKVTNQHLVLTLILCSG